MSQSELIALLLLDEVWGPLMRLFIVHQLYRLSYHHLSQWFDVTTTVSKSQTQLVHQPYHRLWSSLECFRAIIPKCAILFGF